MTPSEYQKHKGLNHENLRDHMTDLELIFSMLGEASTTEITLEIKTQMDLMKTSIVPRRVEKLPATQSMSLKQKAVVR
jgi:hypothetical protein